VAMEVLEQHHDLEQARALLGHARIDTTQIYTSIRPPQLKRAVSFYEEQATRMRPSEDVNAWCAVTNSNPWTGSSWSPSQTRRPPFLGSPVLHAGSDFHGGAGAVPLAPPS
jgi:hypothetical protein